MSIRFEYYELFSLLHNGYSLIKLGDGNPPYFYLDGHPSANIFGREFVEKGWVKTSWEDKLCKRVFYIMSEQGQLEFVEGQKWYNSLPWWYKIFGKLFILFNRS